MSVSSFNQIGTHLKTLKDLAKAKIDINPVSYAVFYTSNMPEQSQIRDELESIHKKYGFYHPEALQGLFREHIVNRELGELTSPEFKADINNVQVDAGKLVDVMSEYNSAVAKLNANLERIMNDGSEEAAAIRRESEAVLSIGERLHRAAQKISETAGISKKKLERNDQNRKQDPHTKLWTLDAFKQELELIERIDPQRISFALITIRGAKRIANDHGNVLADKLFLQIGKELGTMCTGRLMAYQLNRSNFVVPMTNKSIEAESVLVEEFNTRLNKFMIRNKLGKEQKIEVSVKFIDTMVFENLDKIIQRVA